MSSTATNIKRSPSRTPSLGTPPQTPRVVAKTSAIADLSSGEPQIKQELERWETLVFSFSMEGNNRRSSSQEYPGDHQPTNNTPPLHQLPESHIQPTIGGVPGFATPWDIHPFFPGTPYGQQSSYDMLGLGAMNSIPPSHAGAHSIPDPFGATWDMGLHTGVPAHSQIQPLTPAEIAQYHALLARGAGNFAFHPPDAPQPTQAPEVASSTQTPARGRSTSSAGGSTSHRQPSVSNVTDEEVIVITEDKRRRNTAASARFRVKKKQRTMELEETVVELEGRADQLEKEAVELRKENGWLKEMVILKGRKAMGNIQAASVGIDPSDSGSRGHSNDNSKEVDGMDKGKGKSKET